MPFGEKEVPKKPSADVASPAEAKEETLKVDFNAVYQELFKPALEAAGLQPFRADDEKTAGDILKDMFAELVTADFVLADISILNANVFYELGVRHMVGPRGVICLHAGWAERPFDVAPQRTFRYDGQLFRTDRAHDAAWKAAVEKEWRSLATTIADAVALDRTNVGSPIYNSLGNLKPADASAIETGRFTYYKGVADEWWQRIRVAKEEGRAEDILTLAGDVPSPYYRRRLLRDCADALVALGRFSQAEQIYEELCEDLGETEAATAFRVRCQLALIANRLSRTREARVKLVDLAKERPGDPEAQGLLGRVYKDMWRVTWDTQPAKPIEERLRIAQSNAALARDSLESYEVALRRDVGSYYNGINVLTMAALIDLVAASNKKTAKPALPDFDDVAAAVRLSASGALNIEEDVWARATLGELNVILGRTDEAASHYEEATADANLTWFNIRSMLEQIELFELLGYKPEVVQPIASLLRQRQDERVRPPMSNFKKVAICSGHMIDQPDRAEPRFPASKEAAAAKAIAEQLEGWNIGVGDLAICGGARGADILFAEECLRRGAHVRLLLAQEIGEFVRDSVELPGSDWVKRFHTLREQAEVALQPERLGDAPKDVSIYARTNLWVINSARIEASDSSDIYALLVWDEKPAGDGPGGTSDFQVKVRDLGGYVAIINPTKIN
jgi:tetratricopeptide (TPR) repeat protein